MANLLLSQLSVCLHVNVSLRGGGVLRNHMFPVGGAEEEALRASRMDRLTDDVLPGPWRGHFWPLTNDFASFEAS